MDPVTQNSTLNVMTNELPSLFKQRAEGSLVDEAAAGCRRRRAARPPRTTATTTTPTRRPRTAAASTPQPLPPQCSGGEREAEEVSIFFKRWSGEAAFKMSSTLLIYYSTRQAEQFPQEGEEGSIGGPGGDELPLPARIPEQLGLVFAQRDLLQLRAECNEGTNMDKNNHYYEFMSLEFNSLV